MKRRTCRRKSCAWTRQQIADNQRFVTQACNDLDAEKKKVTCLTLAIEKLPKEHRDEVYRMARALSDRAGTGVRW
jgi:hypothetical protein